MAAYFPPPAAEIASAERLPIAIPRLPLPQPKKPNVRLISRNETEIIHSLVNKALENAPEIRLKDGRRFRGWILIHYGDSATVFTSEGKHVVSIAPESRK